MTKIGFKLWKNYREFLENPEFWKIQNLAHSSVRAFSTQFAGVVEGSDKRQNGSASTIPVTIARRLTGHPSAYILLHGAIWCAWHVEPCPVEQ